MDWKTRFQRKRTGFNLSRAGSFNMVHSRQHRTGHPVNVQLERATSLNVIPTSINDLSEEERQRLVDERSQAILSKFNRLQNVSNTDSEGVYNNHDDIDNKHKTPDLYSPNNNTRLVNSDDQTHTSTSYQNGEHFDLKSGQMQTNNDQFNQSYRQNTLDCTVDSCRSSGRTDRSSHDQPIDNEHTSSGQSPSHIGSAQVHDGTSYSLLSQRMNISDEDREKRIAERSQEILTNLFNKHKKNIEEEIEHRGVTTGALSKGLSMDNIPLNVIRESLARTHAGSRENISKIGLSEPGRPGMLLMSHLAKSSPNLTLYHLSTSSPTVSSRPSICESILEEESFVFAVRQREGDPWDWIDQAFDSLEDLKLQDAANGFEDVIHHTRQQLTEKSANDLNLSKLLIQALQGLEEVIDKQGLSLRRQQIEWQAKTVQGIVLLNESIARCNNVLRYSSDDQRNLWFEEQRDDAMDKKRKLLDELVRTLLEVCTHAGRRIRTETDLDPDKVDLNPVIELQKYIIKRFINRSLETNEINLEYLNTVVDLEEADKDDDFDEVFDGDSENEENQVVEQTTSVYHKITPSGTLVSLPIGTTHSGRVTFSGECSHETTPFSEEEVTITEDRNEVRLRSAEGAIVQLDSCFRVLANAMNVVSEKVFQQPNFERASILFDRTLKLYMDVFEEDACNLDLASVNLHMGILQCKSGELTESLKYLEKALDMYKEIHEGPHDHTASALYELGNVHVRLCLKGETILDYVAMATRNEIHHELHKDIKKGSRGQRPRSRSSETGEEDYTMNIHEAVTFYSQTLSMLKKLSSKNKELLMANTLARMGDCSFIVSNHEDSILYYEEAQDLLRQTHTHKAFAENAHVLCMLGCVNFMLHNYAKASTMYQCAHLMRQHNQRDANAGFSHAFSLSLWGMTCLATKNYDKCCSWCLQAYNIYEEIYHGDISNLSKNKFWLVCETLYALGHCNTLMLLYDKAVHYLTIAHGYLNNAQCEVDNKQVIRVLRALGDVHNAQDEHELALRYYNEALELNISEERESGLQMLQNKLLNYGAGIHVSLQQYTNAAMYLQKANKVQKDIEEDIKGDMVSLLFQLGSVYSLSGDVSKAMECYQESLDSYKQMYDGRLGPEMAPTLGNLALLCHIKACSSTTQEDQNKLLSRAKDCFEDSLDLEFNHRICADYGNFLIATGFYPEAGDNLLDILLDPDDSVVVYSEFECPILPPLIQRWIKTHGEISLPVKILAAYLSVLAYKAIGLDNDCASCVLSLVREVYQTDSIEQYTILGYSLMEISMFDEAAAVFQYAETLDDFSMLVQDDKALSLVAGAYSKIAGTLLAVLDRLEWDNVPRSKYSQQRSQENTDNIGGSIRKGTLDKDWDRPHNRRTAEYGRHRTDRVALRGPQFLSSNEKNDDVKESYPDEADGDNNMEGLSVSQKLSRIKKKLMKDHGITLFEVGSIRSSSNFTQQVEEEPPMEKEDWEITETEDPWDTVINSINSMNRSIHMREQDREQDRIASEQGDQLILSKLDASSQNLQNVLCTLNTSLKDDDGDDAVVMETWEEVTSQSSPDSDVAYEEVYDTTTGRWIRKELHTPMSISTNTSTSTNTLSSTATWDSSNTSRTTSTMDVIEDEVNQGQNTTLRMIKDRVPFQMGLVKQNLNATFDSVANDSVTMETMNTYEEVYNPTTRKWEQKEANNNKPSNAHVISNNYTNGYQSSGDRGYQSSFTVTQLSDGEESEDECSYVETFDETTGRWIKIRS